jgi:hypothetical protein
MRRVAGLACCAAAALLTGITALPAYASTGHGGSIDRIADALIHGDGGQAAHLVREERYANDTHTLGEIVFRGGVRSTKTESETEFEDATATMLTQGGVSMAGSGQAFQVAATKAAQQGLTPDEARVGAETVAKTYKAYAVG